ncbi:hypothetical protein BDV23DRAFT_178586 [Aspergillus alliaceus]|uniref:Uncharacterized protein n=1 Tax=Petromyces alliaceus TaxID=209559 RepID=A0A5N7CN04_PETAA|nr:hypothetical protein BDV23DRAFT_178586 [Aspergillus alliaceus]
MGPRPRAQRRPSPQYPELFVVIPSRPDIHKEYEKKATEKRAITEEPEYAVPKTEEDYAAYFQQIRRGPVITSVRVRRFLTHLLLEQAKSVNTLQRVMKALEELQESNEIVPGAEAGEPRRELEQGLDIVAPPASEEQQPQTMATCNDFEAYAPCQPSEALFQLRTNSIPEPQEPQVPHAAVDSTLMGFPLYRALSYQPPPASSQPSTSHETQQQEP